MRLLLANNTFRLSVLVLALSMFSLLVAQCNAMIFFLLFLDGIAILVIQKHKEKLSKRDIIIGSMLSLLCVPSNAFLAIFTLPAYLASTLVCENSHEKIYILKNPKEYNILKTSFLILGVGGILAGLNVFLALSSMPFQTSFEIRWIFESLRAGIFEEVMMRMFLFTICILVTKNMKLTMMQNFLCYMVMILPHVLMHFYASIDIMNVIVLIVLFGIPLSLMQRKQNLVSAIGAHTLIDLVRFMMLGV